MEPVDLGQIARGAATLALAHPSRAENVRVDVQVDGGILPFVGDEDLLHRAVYNLVLNALQASPAGSTVHVSARAVERAHLPSGVPFDSGAFEIAVADAGPGIAPEIAERLFEPFSTTKPGGSGLGLAVTNRAIEAHRGCVLVDSNGVGTRFTVLLPRTPHTTGDPA
jgi:two-component system sensor histidine kinase PilS (NtrC family)